MAVAWPAIWILGTGQCVYWGILYYAFSVLLVPMRDEFGVSSAAVAGAFSVGLAINALLATTVGRWLDRGLGTQVLRNGALAGAAGLFAWSLVRDVWSLYVVWVCLGACMSMVLYETAFALVTRAFADPGQRLRALASVTVMGGLASTVFLPLLGAGVANLDWRSTLRLLVIVWLLTAWWMERAALPDLRAADIAGALVAPEQSEKSISPGTVVLAGIPFVAASFAAMFVTTLVIPTLVDRGHPIDAAAWVLAALGIMQLPGRLWLWRGGGRALSARGLLLAPMLLQACGLGLLAVSTNLPMAFCGVAVFGIGAGLHTLARPWAVPLLFGVASAGRVNGAIARAQGVARSAGPFLAATAYGHVGSRSAFGALAFVMLLLCPAAYALAQRTASAARATSG